VTPSPTAEVPFSQAVRIWLKIGLLGFGGPAGQVALMHRELVQTRRWIDEERFLHALNYCMLLPGPEAQQLAIYIGWLLHRTAGGLVAGGLFVLPGFLAILLLSVLYASFGQLPAVAALFFGLKTAVLAIVIEAVLRIGKRALSSRLLSSLALLAFLAIFLLDLPFPLLVAGAGLVGLVGSRLLPSAFPEAKPQSATAQHDTVLAQLAAAGKLEHTRPSAVRTLRVLLTWALIWALPLGLIHARLGSSSVLFEEGLFFSRAAVVTFGGAYAVLAYVAQQAVARYHWLMPGEMLDGLGLAETTPGPLILVVQFVGFLGAFRHPGGFTPLLAGVLGAVTTVWATFAPCFLWIFVGAPYIEALRGSRPLRAALSAITAAVVGVIVNLSLWFTLHVIFRHVTERHFGPLRLLVPEPSSVDPAALVLAGLALVAMFKFELGLPRTLAGSALLGFVWKLVSG
jgi:chromate transporter